MRGSVDAEVGEDGAEGVDGVVEELEAVGEGDLLAEIEVAAAEEVGAVTRRVIDLGGGPVDEGGDDLGYGFGGEVGNGGEGGDAEVLVERALAMGFGCVYGFEVGVVVEVEMGIGGGGEWLPY